jgi:DNA-nicking Smr family endonuclease
MPSAFSKAKVIKSVKSLSDLSRLREQLARAAAARDEQVKKDRELAIKQQQEANLFREAVKDAAPLPKPNRADTSGPKPSTRALQFERDEQLALWQSLSDEMDIERLLDTDSALSYRRPGIGEDVTRRLRKGHWAIQDQIDLHGLRVDQARSALAQFFSQAQKKELRCLRIIHGKGLGSINKEPVLKTKVMGWLIQREEVIAFCQARPNDGGAGALVVLLNAVGNQNKLAK